METARQWSSGIAGWPTRWTHWCMQGVWDSAPTDGTVQVHDRLLAAVARLNERAEPSRALQRPQNVLISLDAKAVPESC